MRREIWFCKHRFKEAPLKFSKILAARGLKSRAKAAFAVRTAARAISIKLTAPNTRTVCRINALVFKFDAKGGQPVVKTAIKVWCDGACMDLRAVCSLNLTTQNGAETWSLPP